MTTEDFDEDERSSFRELTGKALFILATGVGGVHERIILAYTELELARMYRNALPDELRERFDDLLKKLSADGEVGNTVSRMSGSQAKALAVEIYELSWMARDL